MTTGETRKRILFVAPKTEAQPVLGQLRFAGHLVSLVEDLDEAELLLGSGRFDQTVLAASKLSSLLEQRLLWESTDADAWRRSTSAIAHDVGNLLMALERAIGGLERDERERGPLTSDLGEVRLTISTLSAFLQELTAELGAGGRRELTLTRVDLEDAVEAAAMAVYPSASERRQRLVIDVDDAVRKVQADSAKLKRVLTNLLRYASHQTPRLGTVTVRAYQDHQNCVISVSHRGTPVGGSKLGDSIRPISDKDSLAGIGLSGVETLVAQHDGRLWIESQKGSGTSVFVSLPALTNDLDNQATYRTRGS